MNAIADQSPKGRDPQGLDAKHASGGGASQSPKPRVTNPMTPTAGELAACHRFTGDQSDLRMRFNEAIGGGPNANGDSGWIIHTNGHAADMEAAIERIAALTPTQDGPSAEPAAWLYERNGVKCYRAERSPDYTTPAMDFAETPLFAAMPLTASTVNKAMLEALERAQNFIANTEGELGITLDSGDVVRAAIALARGEPAQAMSASGQDRNGLEAKHESAVATPCAQTEPS